MKLQINYKCKGISGDTSRIAVETIAKSIRFLKTLSDSYILLVHILLEAGNTTGAAAAEKKWYENTDQIATFLSNANPYWSKEALKNMLDNHLALTKAEAVARLTGNYTADIATYDKVRQEANMMSDALVDGIVNQFPNKFSKTSIITTPSPSFLLLQPKAYRV